MVDQLASESKVAPGFADRGFWISKTGGLLIFFVIPVDILLVFNLVMLVKSANSIRKQKKINKVATSSVRSKTSTSSSMTQKYELDEGKLHKIITDKVKKSLEDHADDIEMLKLIASLAIVMGIPWIFSVFIDVSIVFEYLFNIFNSLQGVFIFLAFDCRQKTWEVIKGTCCKSRSNVVNSTTQVIKINLSTSSSREEGPSSSAKKSSRSKDSSKMRGSSCTSRSTVDTVISHDTGGRSDETKQTLLPNPLDSIETENFAARQSRVSHSQSVVLESDSSQFKREQVTLIIPSYEESVEDHELHPSYIESHTGIELNINSSSVSSQEENTNVVHKRKRRRRRKRVVQQDDASQRTSSGTYGRNYSMKKAYFSSAEEDTIDV